MRWKQADFLSGLFVLAGFALIISIIAVVRGQIGGVRLRLACAFVLISMSSRDG